MNCNEIRELISSMLDHELTQADSAVVTEHLAECPECMRVFEAFHAISVSLEELEDVPDGFTEAVMHKINTPAPVKKRRPGYLRMAGLAACLALVIFTGSRFVTSHLHSDDRNIQDTAQYARVTHQTPAPTPTPVVTAEVIINSTDVSPAPVSEAVVPDTEGLSKIEQSATDTPADTAAATPEVSVTPRPTPTPRPTATPRPTPTPGVTALPELEALSDLLIVAEDADFDVNSLEPDYEVTVTDDNGNEVQLQIWITEERIYCRNVAAGTAWYTFGTAEKLQELLYPVVIVSPMVSPEASPAVIPTLSPA